MCVQPRQLPHQELPRCNCCAEVDLNLQLAKITATQLRKLSIGLGEQPQLL